MNTVICNESILAKNKLDLANQISVCNSIEIEGNLFSKTTQMYSFYFKQGYASAEDCEI